MLFVQLSFRFAPVAPSRAWRRAPHIGDRSWYVAQRLNPEMVGQAASLAPLLKTNGVTLAEGNIPALLVKRSHAPLRKLGAVPSSSFGRAVIGARL